MKVFNRRNVLKGGLVGSMAAGFASFVGASHAAEPAAKAPAQNDKNTYDVIVARGRSCRIGHCHRR